VYGRKEDELLQVGAFPHYGGRWAEWNGKFRDTVRSFIKGSEGPWAKAFASAVCGSPTIYSAKEPGEGNALITCYLFQAWQELGVTYIVCASRLHVSFQMASHLLG